MIQGVLKSVRGTTEGERELGPAHQRPSGHGNAELTIFTVLTEEQLAHLVGDTHHSTSDVLRQVGSDTSKNAEFSNIFGISHLDETIAIH
ncbi:hypothetical protein D3C72_1552550 [compost metagenome]